MRKLITLLATAMLALTASAQTSLKGVLTTAEGQPIVDAKVTLGNQGISTNTNSKGEFVLLYLEPINEEVVISADNFLQQVKAISLQKDQENDLGTISLKEDIATETKQDVTVQLSEDDLDADDDGKGQAMASSSSAEGDVFTKYISYAWSSARYRVRGYEQKEENTYINGISFNGAERGMFSYSSLGGLNDASRNKDVYNGIEANGFTFGGIGSSTNILMNAARFARGWKIGLAGSNRLYKGRVNATFGTGLMDNGWAFAASVALRYSPYIDKKGALGEGIQYSSLGYFFSAEKRFEDGKGGKHDFNLATFGSPTERGQNAAVTQEVYDLTGSIYYNPYWGYQNGKVRNSRVVQSYDPTVLFNYEWKSADGKHNVKAGLAYHYSMYSNSALTFYNAPDPRPDYYRNLPSYLLDNQLTQDGYLIDKTWNGNTQGEGSWSGTAIGNGFSAEGMPSINGEQYNTLTSLWQNRDDNTTQINWTSLYAANYAQNAINPNGSARYIIERRHNDLEETALNAVYQGKFVGDHLKLTAGLEGKSSKGMHYKTVDDLLGGNQWLDVDAFSERDMKELANNVNMTQGDIYYMQQNDLNYYSKYHQARAVTKGDRFGYDYNIYIGNVALWVQNEWNFNHVDFYYGIKGTYNCFQREGNMDNGRATYLKYVYGPENQNLYSEAYLNTAYKSYGMGYLNSFLTPAAKAGVTYKIDGHNSIKANAIFEQKAPLARDAYISQRLYDRTVAGLKHSTDYSVDLTYEWKYRVFSGRVTGFYTEQKNLTKQSGYYDDGYNTFINYAITGLNSRNMGVELGASVKLGSMFTLSGAFSYMDNRYTSDAAITSSAENGMALANNTKGKTLYEVSDSIYTKGLKVATGPQLVGSLKLSFFHPKMWFADITVTYYDHNYLDFAPSRRSYGFMRGTTANGQSNADVSLNGAKGNTATPNSGNAYQTCLLQKDEEGNIMYTSDGAPIVQSPYNTLTDQESLVDDKIWNRFMVDLSVGKLFYLKNRQSLSVNLQVSNLLNNTHFKTGGYQQGRIAANTVQQAVTKVGQSLKQTKVVSSNVWKYPAKYYYAWGANFFLSLTYKF